MANHICEQIAEKLDFLFEKPDQVDAISEQVEQLLRTCTAKRQIFDVAKRILEKGFSLSDRSAFPIFGKFLSQLIGTTIVCAESGKLCSFKDALCSCLSHPVVLNWDAFGAFCRKLPLMNEMFKLRFVQWSVMKVLISGLQHNDEISIRYLFELIRNTDHLVDEHIAAFPKANTDPYWCSCVGRLKQAIDNGVITDSSVLDEMDAFFHALKHKHRWCSALTISPNEKKRKSSKSESECVPVKRSSPSFSNDGESQMSPIAKIMDTLSRDPANFLLVAISKAKKILAASPNSAAFIESVLEILNASYSAESRVFSACVELLEGLRDLSVDNVSFGEAVTRCTTVTKGFETPEQIDRFCSSFRLTNELVRIGLISSNIFQNYAANLTNGDGGSSLLLLFKILTNVQKLVDSGCVKLTGDEAKFWTCQNRRLTGALHRNLIQSPKLVSEISEFLKSHEMKGGWNQTPVCEKREDIELKKMISGIALVGNFKPWLWPLLAKFQAMPTPSEFSASLRLFLVKMCELIVDERTLKEAGEICKILANSDFGRGRGFVQELQNFCVTYLTEKQAGDTEHMGLKAANPSLEKLLYLLMKRRQGCARLIGHLYLEGMFDVYFLITFCDALLGTRTFSTMECLFWLFSDIGRKFSSAVVENGILTWWTAFFEEMCKLAQNASTPDEVKRLAKAILVEKAQWPMLDAKARARDSLAKLLNDLTPELKRSSPSDFASVLQKIRNLLANELNDNHALQMFEILLAKIERTFKDTAENINNLPANPTPLPTSD